MKEDILEQLVEDWFVSRPGWFIKHNIRYRPNANREDYNKKQDSVHSDIDLLAVNMNASGKKKIAVVTCKSWQSGFNPKGWLAELSKDAIYNQPTRVFKKKEGWKYFRELVSDKWIDAFVNTIERETGQKDFTYYIAVTRLKGTEESLLNFENSKVFQQRFTKFKSAIDVRILTLHNIIDDYNSRIAAKDTPYLESTDVGRFLQLINAAKLKIKSV